ncbi:F-box/WD repeat-containing protein [Sporobolomyces koalae]|uniref:F-box/WD repeat-containing protein n=1 Tax=Sporobolomyces koalae TaxID=500713 RepID=UPI00317B5D4A
MNPAREPQSRRPRSPSPAIGRLETVLQHPQAQSSTTTIRTTRATAGTSLTTPRRDPHLAVPAIDLTRTHLDHPEQSHPNSDQMQNSTSDYAELHILPSTTETVTTTTTTWTTHFAPLRIPKSRLAHNAASSTSRPASASASSSIGPGLDELIDRDLHGLGGSSQLDLKSYPLSQTPWSACGLDSFKLELGDLHARYEHEAAVAHQRDRKGKGKQVATGTFDGARWQEDGDTMLPAREPESRGTTLKHGSPGPPPRKRPRSSSSERRVSPIATDQNAKISLPSPHHSPLSPVPSIPEAESDPNPATPVRDADQLCSLSPTALELPSFDLGQARSISALLSLPDLVDSFDQLSAPLQSYLIFSLLRRSSVPVLQTVANIVVPALRRDFLTDLPPELSLQILGYLEPTTLCRASLVSKSWARLIDGEARLWKKLLDRDGLWIGDGSEEREACEIETGRKENWFLDRWKAGVWDPSQPATGARRTDFDHLPLDDGTEQQRRVSISAASVRPASPSSSREPSPVPEPPRSQDLLPHSVNPYKILYRRRWLTRQNWKYAEPKRTTFSSTTAATNVVTCLQFDEEKIVSASDDEDHLIHVFDTQTGYERAELRGHTGGVWALQYVGNVLVSGSTDRSVRVWDLDSARCTHEFIGHTSTVRCLQIVEPTNVNPDPNGAPIWEPPYPLVVTGSRDWTLRVWKLPLAGRDREYHPAVPMSPTEGGVVEPYDNPYHERQLSGHRHAVRAVAAAGRTVVSGSYDHTVRVWDLLTGKCTHVLEGHSQKVYAVVLDHRRNQCASGSMDGTVKIWSVGTGEQLFSLDGHSSLVGLLGLSHRCLVSAAADWTLRIWNPETGECRHALNAHQGAITCFQHDEYKIVSGSDGTLKMWDTQTGEFVRDLLANLTGVWQVAFNQRYCIAAVQRNGSSEFELLDFGAVDQDEIKPSRIRSPPLVATRPVLDHTPVTHREERPAESATIHAHRSTTFPLGTNMTTTPSAAASRTTHLHQPPPLRGPRQNPTFGSNLATTPERPRQVSVAATLRHVDSNRHLGSIAGSERETDLDGSSSVTLSVPSEQPGPMQVEEQEPLDGVHEDEAMDVGEADLGLTNSVDRQHSSDQQA